MRRDAGDRSPRAGRPELRQPGDRNHRPGVPQDPGERPASNRPDSRASRTHAHSGAHPCTRTHSTASRSARTGRYGHGA